MVVAWLIETTGSDLSPAWYLAGAYLLATIAGLILPESAPGRLGKIRPATGTSEAPA